MGQNIEDFLTMGVDLGGTKIEMALVDANGRILSSHHHPTNSEKDPERIITDIISNAHLYLKESEERIHALGIGVAGQVDLNGVVRFAPNLGWRNLPLKARLKDRLGLPVFVTNDVRAATLGEWRYGSGRGLNDFVVLFVGTGVGGGVVSGGHILIGCTNTAGELGHMTIIQDGRQCHCPNKGCLEAYVSGWAIAERAREAVRDNPHDGQNIISLAGDTEDITAITLGQAYHEGDPLAQELIEETGKYLVTGVANIVNAFNPCRFVLGGGVIEGIPELIDIVRRNIPKRALEPAVKELEIMKAILGKNAGVIGAAILARSEVLNHIQTTHYHKTYP